MSLWATNHPRIKPVPVLQTSESFLTMLLFFFFLQTRRFINWIQMIWMRLRKLLTEGGSQGDGRAHLPPRGSPTQNWHAVPTGPSHQPCAKWGVPHYHKRCRNYLKSTTMRLDFNFQISANWGTEDTFRKEMFTVTYYFLLV